MAPGESADDSHPADTRDRAGADSTARLLLALTALYVQRSNHTAEEQRQYTELALHLIDKAGMETRAAVAARLRPHPDAPDVVIERLGLAPTSCDGEAGEKPAHLPRDHGRVDPPAGDQARSSEAKPHAGSAPRPAAEESDGSPATPLPADAPAARQPLPLTPEFGEAFFAASPAERLRMLSLLAVADAGDTEAEPESSKRFHVRIDIAPWQGRTGAFARDFARLIDAPEGVCARILHDASGEPMVIAARATGMPVAMLQRILLVASPATHHSVQRVYELTELYHALDRGTARALLALWRSTAETGGPQTASLPVTNLRARFGALSTRIESRALTGRADPESAGPRGLPSR